MDQFSLDKFKKPDEIPIVPSWVLDGPPVTLKLYEAVQNMVLEKEVLIKSSAKKVLGVKDRQLVNSQIAELAGVDKSNLREDRQSLLLKYIEQENIKLDQLWKNTSEHPKKGQKPSKSDLARDKSIYERQLSEIKNERLVGYFQEALSSEVLNEQKYLIAKYKQLEIDYEKAQTTIANLRKQNGELLRCLNQ